MKLNQYTETIDEFGMEPNPSKLEATVLPESTPAL